MEFNDELIARLKKDPSNPDFKTIWYKKKKIDGEVQKFKEKKEAQEKTKRSKSKSPMKKLKSKALAIEDLVTEESKKEKTLLSESKQSHIQNDYSDDIPSSLGERRMSNSTKKLSSAAITSKKAQNIFDSFQATNEKKTDSTTDFQSGTKMAFYTPVLNFNGSTRFGVGSKNPFQDENLKGEESCSFLNLFHSRTLNIFDIEKMGEDEISKEIVKLEREITELRREQKNIQSKIQYNIGENVSEFQSKLNQISLDIETKNEMLKALKRKQRELISKEL